MSKFLIIQASDFNESEKMDFEEITPKLRGQYSEKYTKESLREAIEKIRTNEMSYGAAS